METDVKLPDTQPRKRVSRLLEEAEKAIHEGNLREAYELSLQATEAAPELAEALARRSELAPSLEERIATGAVANDCLALAFGPFQVS